MAQQGHSIALGSKGSTEKPQTSSQAFRQGTPRGTSIRLSQGKDEMRPATEILPEPASARATAAAAKAPWQRQSHEEFQQGENAPAERKSLQPADEVSAFRQPATQLPAIYTGPDLAQQPPLKDVQGFAVLASESSSISVKKPAVPRLTLPSPDRRPSGKSSRRRSVREGSENSQTSNRRLGERLSSQCLATLVMEN